MLHVPLDCSFKISLSFIHINNNVTLVFMFGFSIDIMPRALNFDITIA